MPKHRIALWLPGLLTALLVPINGTAQTQVPNPISEGNSATLSAARVRSLAAFVVRADIATTSRLPALSYLARR